MTADGSGGPDAGRDETDADDVADDGGNGGDASVGPLDCPDGDLVGHVPASRWAAGRADVAAYRYAADVRLTGVASITLLDAAGVALGVLDARQLVDGPDAGAMLGELREGDRVVAGVVSTGSDVSDAGYVVTTRLRDADAREILVAEAAFRTVRCWSRATADTGPPCAGALPDAAEVLPPDCGLITDDRILEGRPAELARLTYLVKLGPGAAVPEGGGVRVVGEERWASFDVFDADAGPPADGLGEWLEQAGAGAFMAADATRRLQAAWLDRAWWRAIETHVAWCDVSRLPEPGGTGGAGGDLKSRCPGDHSPAAWGRASSAPRSSGVWGDPHIVSFDGYGWSLQAAGEFVLARAHTGAPFELQARFEPMEIESVPGCGQVTVATALATRIGDRRVTVRNRPGFEVRVDGVAFTPSSPAPPLPVGASVEVSAGELRLVWPDASSLTVDGEGPFLRATLSLAEARSGEISGLLGTFDGRVENDLVLPDGAVIAQPADFATRYTVLAPAWRVGSSGGIFDYAEGEGPGFFDRDEFPWEAADPASLPPDAVAEATATCRGLGVTDGHRLLTCVFDLVCSGDPNAARAAAAAPVAIAAQGPGGDAVAVFGDVRLVTPPAAVDLSVEATPDTCAAWAPAGVEVFAERSDALLSASLPLDLAPLDGAVAVPAGTRVTTWHVQRRARETGGRTVGSVRFDRPVLGIVATARSLTSTDGTLGRDGTRYGAALPGAGDAIRLSPDGRTLFIDWSGAAPQRLRVILEAP